MSKANRLIELMITINAKRHFTVGELAEKFSVSKRIICVMPVSIQEYLSRLETGGDYYIQVKLTKTGVKRCESE